MKGPLPRRRARPSRRRAGRLAGLLRADRWSARRHRGGEPADRHRYWLTRPAFTGRFVHPVTAADGHLVRAWIDWPAAITALDHGELPSSGSEAHLLRIAASLGTGTPIVLREVLGGLDPTNITAVTSRHHHRQRRPTSE